MGRSLQQIEQDLIVLAQKGITIAQHLRDRYEEYVQLLGQTMKQQLILAGYQICTQKYPEDFLALTLKQQQQLQRSLRDLGEQAASSLRSALDNSPPPTFELEASPTAASDLERPQEALSLQELSSEDDEEDDMPLNAIEAIASWGQDKEEAIAATLQLVSIGANRSLHQAGILPSMLPEKVIEAAVQSEEAGAGSPPNLANIFIEIGGDKEGSQESQVIQFTAIRLRLSELEFANPELNQKRQELRKLAQQVSGLLKQERAIDRECAVAKAELAWRTSWYED